MVELHAERLQVAVLLRRAVRRRRSGGWPRCRTGRGRPRPGSAARARGCSRRDSRPPETSPCSPRSSLARARTDTAEVVDLLPGVVVVELARDRVALGASRLPIASPSAACRPWPTCSGPVGLAETNSIMTRSPACAFDAAERIALGQYARDDRLSRRGRDRHVDEAGAGDFHALDDRRRRHRGDDRLRELARTAARGLGERERDVRCVVAVRRLLRPLDLHRRAGVRRQPARRSPTTTHVRVRSWGRSRRRGAASFEQNGGL